MTGFMRLYGLPVTGVGITGNIEKPAERVLRRVWVSVAEVRLVVRRNIDLHGRSPLYAVAEVGLAVPGPIHIHRNFLFVMEMMGTRRPLVKLNPRSDSEAPI